MGKAYGIVALITGIFGLAISATAALLDLWSFFLPNILPIISIMGWVLPIVAIIFGILGIIMDDSKGMAITGFIFGIIGLIVRFLISYLFATFLASLIP